MPTFTFLPDFGPTKSAKPRIRKAQFGDGYTQAVRYGINSLDEQWNLTFSKRSLAEADAIEAFFDASSYVEPFDWTPPGESAKRYRVSEWTRTNSSAGLFDLTAKFDRVYEP